MLRDCPAGRLNMPRATEPADVIEAGELTEAHLFDRKPLGKFPKLFHPPETHGAVGFRRFTRAALSGTVVSAVPVGPKLHDSFVKAHGSALLVPVSGA